ncbi:TRAP transporter substrate-binding protein [Desulfopila aestuarii]|uniref:TRAP-type C4-dicarboxylate transport system, substrate-binding protein n=1 Tax=Desulfopila aestuarii DSM 18488 TaxID=1121416 RepID=A0A1M7XWU3_9BACT|nr:TRAP transporter substrate-binding protein DctP [Desulfopila aestuarii]SHO43241.1 TRAP-type C4-dicarboxylate transport system, substrate-binding protein [Desulfopila aestuarii DSM 18488]
MRFIIVVLMTLLLNSSLGVNSAQAGPKHLFKIASLAPDGSVWVTQFEKFTKEVTEKTGGEVGFRVYAGGIMGDDQAMYRKMRVGQLHGGGFTMTGIASVVPDFRIMSIPFLFNNYQEVDAVSEGLMPLFQEQFSKQGLEFIARTEVGFIYTMSTKPVVSTEELKKSTIWIPAGDPLAATFIDQIGLSPVQLSIPDVLSSLQTGLIDTVFNSLYGSIVLQWFTKAKYVTDNPFGYAYGVFLLDKKKFDKLPPKYATIIRESAAKHFSVLIEETRKSNDESNLVLKKQGVTFVKANPDSLRELQTFRQKTIDKAMGSAFSEATYNKMMKILDTYRAAHKTSGH